MKFPMKNPLKLPAKFQWIFAALALTLAAPAARAAPEVAVSLLPVHSLVSAGVGRAGEPQLLF